MRRSTRVVPLATVAAVAALVTTLAPTAVGAASAASTTSAVATSAAHAAAGPWGDASYTPQPGGWRDYVLAPADRDVAPTSVTADPRGGSVTGDPSAALATGGATVRLTSTGDRTTSPLLVVDFGKEVSGLPRLRVTGASDPAPTVRVCFSESKKYRAVAPGQTGGETAFAPGCDTANIFNGFAGAPYTYDSDSHAMSAVPSALPATLTDTALRGGYRYATFFLDGPGSVDVDAADMRFTAAPAQSDLRAYAGHFLSSDDQLNKIWYAGAYTVQVDTDRSDTAKSWPYADGEGDHADDQVPGVAPDQEVIFDGGKRDRIVWQGDLAVQAPVTYLSTQDLGAVRNSLDSLAGQQLADGFVPAESQVGPHNSDELRTYGEYVTWFVNNMYAHWLYTGDRAYLEKWYPAVTRAMAWLESVRQQDDEGLIGFGGVGSCGHYGYTDCGHETYVNALYVRNLHQSAVLARALGEPRDGRTYDARATEVAGQVNAQLWDTDAGAYRLSREIPTAFPQDANATAVLTGVATPRRARSAMDYLQRTSWAKLGALTVAPGTPNASLPSFYAPLPSSFEVDARLADRDVTQLRQSSGVELMKRFWGWMLAQDPGSTFWEHVQPDGTPNLGPFSSLAHGWAAGPTVSLTERVLGISPTGAGYATYDVAPHPDTLKWAQGRVPTPHGNVDASWKHASDGTFTMTTRSPAGTVGTLRVPTFGDKVKVKVDGTKVWDGTRGTATLQGGYVVVAGVKPGGHTVASTPLTRTAAVDLSGTPDAVTTRGGSTETLSVALTGRAPATLTGKIALDLPKGWVADPSPVKVSLASNGRPVTQTYDVEVTVPKGAPAATKAVTVRFTGSGVTALATTVFTVNDSATLYDFESGDQGWSAGDGVASVSRVSSFANGPGTPYAGSGALDAASRSVPADSWRTVQVTPSGLDLTDTGTLTAHVDGYGGMPGATGYEARVTLTGAGGDTLTRTFAVTPDRWNDLALDVSGWAARTAVSKIEVGFRATGTAQAWQPHFQVDQVTTKAP